MPIRGIPLSLIDWQVLAEVEVASDCDYVDFTGLDINRDWEYYLDIIIKNPTGSGCTYYLFVEGDYTITNYYQERVRATDTSLDSARVNTSTCGYISPGHGGLFNIKIAKDPDGYFRFTSVNNRRVSSSQELLIRAGSKTAPVSNITSLRVSADISGGIGAGSRFILARPRS